MNRFALLALALCVSSLWSAPAASAEPKRITLRKLQPLSLGLVGYAGAQSARDDSQALHAHLSEKLGRGVTTRIFKDYDALATAVARGEVDLAWLQPFALVAARQQGAVTPLVKAVRHELPYYRGVLFVRGGEKAPASLQALKGLKVAWVEARSAAGYLFPRAALVQAGLEPGQLFASEFFAGDHEAVCRAVLDGRADVGATFADDRPDGEAMRVDGCLQSVGAEAAAGLRIVATSAPIPNDAIVARPGLEISEVARMRGVFLDLAAEETGRALLEAVFKAQRFVEVGDADFDPVGFAAEVAAR